MARIPDEELARIKSQVTVEDLCRDYGIELTRMGPDNLMGRCPFHDDQTPSFGVTPSKNLWNCLAGCGGGDVIELVMRKQNVSLRQAVDILRQRLGILPEDPTIETRSGTTHPMLVPASETELADHVLLKHVLDFYHQTFCDDVKAMRYLQSRRCFDAEAVKLFKIGYSNRTLCYRVPSTTAAGRRLKEQLQRLGVIRESGHEHLSGSVIVPILDEHGNVAQMYGRKVTQKLRPGTPLHLYLPGEHHAVWNAAGLRAGGGQKEWLLCESIIDALTLWCAGFRNVTCAYGVNGFTVAHWALIDEVKPKRIVICYDNDPAGNAAAAKLAEELQARGIVVARAKLPEGKDINDVARLNRDARVALAIALETGGDDWAHSSPAIPAATNETPSETTPSPSPVESLPPLAPVLPAPTTETAKENKPPAPATPVEASPAGDAKKEPPEVDEVNFTFGPRQWRVRGVGKNLAFETLRVQLRVLVQSGGQQNFHLDNLDLCNAKLSLGASKPATDGRFKTSQWLWELNCST